MAMKLNIPVTTFERTAECLREAACILESMNCLDPEAKVSGTISLVIETDGNSPPIAQVIPVPESMWGTDLRSRPAGDAGEADSTDDVSIPYTVADTPPPPPPDATDVDPPPPPPSADVPLDSEGQAWDENLHAKNKSKTMQGTWKKKRGSIAKQPPAITVSAVQAVAGQLVLKGVATERINTIIAQAGTGDPMAVQIAGTDGLKALPLLTAEELTKVWKAMHAEATLIGVAL